MSEPEFTEARAPQPSFTVETAKILAEVAHNRQKDKLKRPYREHVIAVGDALADFDDDIRIAGYLHDIAEDTPMTRQALLDMGVSERAVDIIERVTNAGGAVEVDAALDRGVRIWIVWPRPDESFDGASGRETAVGIVGGPSVRRPL